MDALSERALDVVMTDLTRRGWEARQASPGGLVLVVTMEGVRRLVTVVAARYPDDPRDCMGRALPAHWFALVQLTRNLEPMFAPVYLEPPWHSGDATLPAPVTSPG